VRMQRWQERYDLRERPFVMVGMVKKLRPHLDRADSVRIEAGPYVYVQRTPIRLP